MKGHLMTYHAEKRLTTFETDPECPRVLLFVGGLGDSLRAVPYLDALHRALSVLSCSWSLGQLLLTSSGWRNWGGTTIDQDAEEVAECCRFLHRSRHDRKRTIYLLGHSTGCQAIVRMFQHVSDAIELTDGIILQAPVSDREAALRDVSVETLAHLIRVAEGLVSQGHGDLAFQDDAVLGLYPGSAISARRFVSLNSHMGAEDFFSSDLDRHTLTECFRGISKTPTLFVVGAEDEYIPKTVDKEALLKGFCRACPSASTRSCVLPGADHSIVSPAAQRDFTDRVVAFLSDPKQ